MTEPHRLFPEPKLLLGPGPSNTSARVLSALGKPLMGHLDPEFLGIMDECKKMLRTVFGTSNDVTFPVSGTGSAGMEFALVNFVEPGDRVLVVVQGAFGQRLANLADRLGAQVTRVEAEWGSVVDLEAVATETGRVKPKLLMVVNGETSTGVYQPIPRLGEIARSEGALLVVDCVTSLAGMPVALDAWGVDIAYSGTQKCLSCPPGLSPVSVSPKALQCFEARRCPVPSFYLDLGEILKYVGGQSARAYHHTAPISMIYALHQALAIVLEEGLEARYARHGDAAADLVSRLQPLGFTPMVEEPHRLHPLTTMRVPDGVDEAALRRRLLQEHRIEVGSGMGPMAGKAWRIGLMGVNANPNSCALLAACLTDLM